MKRSGGFGRRDLAAVALPAHLGSRLLVLTAVAVAASTRGDDLIDALRGWDADWYISAADGYSNTPPDETRPWQRNIAFLPVFPLSIRLVAAVTRLDTATAAAVTVHLYGVALALLLALLACQLTSRQGAQRFLWLFWLFPGAAVLSMPYSEAAMLTWAVAALVALLSRRWYLAGVAAALCAATRPNGAVLIVCCLWAATTAVREHGEWQALAAPAITPIGLLAYFGYLWQLTGDPLVWFNVQRLGWQAHTDFGAQVVRDLAALLGDPTTANTTSLLQLLGLATAIVGLGLLAWWRPPPVIVIYTIGTLALPLLTTTGTAAGARPRFVLAAFPIFLGMAEVLRPIPFIVAAVASAGILAATAIVYTTPLWVIP